MPVNELIECKRDGGRRRRRRRGGASSRRVFKVAQDEFSTAGKKNLSVGAREKRSAGKKDSD
jgi:hypothetical protein